MSEQIDESILGPDDQKDHLDFIERQYTGHPVVKVFHPIWKELLEWENGDQFSQWDDKIQLMVPVQLKRRKKKVVINLMKPLAEAIEGKVNFMSQFQGMPNSSELKDTEGSKVATKVLAHNDYVNDIFSLNEDLKYWLIRTGNAFRKWTWENSRFGWIKKSDGSKPEKEEGELVGSVPSVFNLRPDPTAKTMDECRWFIEYEEVSEQLILENFPGVTEEMLKNAQNPIPTQKYRGMFVKQNEIDKNEPTHIVAWHWEKKSKRFPEGRLIISIPGIVLWAKKNPALGRIPYFKYGYKRFGSSFWYYGPLYYVKDIQRDFNRFNSIISEHVEGWRAKMAVPQGSIIKEGAFTTDSFEMVEVDTTKGDVKPLNMPELSQQVINQRDFLLACKDLVSNVHEVSYSQLPQYASRAPASLYAQMVEQENLKIDPMIRQINRTLKEEAKFRLEMMGEYYDKKRLVKVVGTNEHTSIEYFAGADLEGNYDVKLVIGVNIHQSKTIQQKMMLDLKTAGAPIEWDTIFKLLWEGDVSQEIRASYADRERASRENQAFLNGTYDKPFEEGGVQILFHDDHIVHCDSHSKTAKSEEAQRWDDATWKAFNKHLFKHLSLLAQLQQQMKEAAKPDLTQQLAGNVAPGNGSKSQSSPMSSGEETTQAIEDQLPY
jgi:hypothetical protein